MFEIISMICVLIAVIGIIVLLYDMYKENTTMDNTPKIYYHENMLDIEIKTLTEKEIKKLTEMSFAWQPDMTDTRLRMYGSQAILQGLAMDLKEAHPEYEIIIALQ